ncbi:MAG: acyl-CoA synthetase [Micromonosporaceae bacterium]
MSDLLSRVRGGVARLPVVLQSARVLQQRGLLRVTRPDEMLTSLVWVRQFGPFAGAVKIASRRDPDALGLVDDIGELTFTQLDKRSNALARAWIADGMKPGDVIGLLCRDHRGLLDGMFAAAKVGARAVLLNTGFAGRQLADVAVREGISTIAYDQEFAPVVAAVGDDVKRYLAWVDDVAEHPTLEELIEKTSDSDVPAPQQSGGIVLLTSGTTGTPKGAPRQVRSPLAAAEFLDRIPYRRNEATVIAAPLFHGTGLSQFVMTLALASTTVMSRRFDPEQTLARIEKYRCTAMVLVPTMLQRILDLGPEVLGTYDTSSLRILFTAGSALSPEVGNRATEAFGDVIYNLYGSTEVAVATVATPEDWRAAPGTVGKTPVGCRVVLFDADNRPVTEPETQGRVYVSSGLKFGGYTGGGSKDELQGLMSSGDVGHFDAHGRLFIDGRADDMIVSGGENVYPGEVENLLVEHEKINDAAVIGVPDPEFGQRLKAFVVLEPGAELAAEEVKAYVKHNLARHKVPREVAYLDELPRNPTGKLLRNKLS